MSLTAADVSERSSAPRRPRAVTNILVAVAVVVGWLAFQNWPAPRLYVHVYQALGSSTWAYQVTGALLLGVPYAVVLLVWGRTLAASVAGAFVALVVTAYVWGLFEVFERYFWHAGAGERTADRVYLWLEVLVVPTLVALAWGAARRRGRAWLVGLVVAPLLAIVLHELAVHSAWWRLHVVEYDGRPWSWLLGWSTFVWPAIAAAVTCSWIETARAQGSSA